MNDDVFRGYGIKILLSNDQDFLKIKETLTRIGVASKNEKTLYQSCHILHKKGEYAIVHFKEMFSLDGKQTDISHNDIMRRNTITKLLQDWGLLKVVNSEDIGKLVPLSQIKIISFSEKNDWQLIPKYQIGLPKNKY